MDKIICQRCDKQIKIKTNDVLNGAIKCDCSHRNIINKDRFIVDTIIEILWEIKEIRNKLGIWNNLGQK